MKVITDPEKCSRYINKLDINKNLVLTVWEHDSEQVYIGHAVAEYGPESGNMVGWRGSSNTGDSIVAWGRRQTLLGLMQSDMDSLRPVPYFVVLKSSGDVYRFVKNIARKFVFKTPALIEMLLQHKFEVA